MKTRKKRGFRIFFAAPRTEKTEVVRQILIDVTESLGMKLRRQVMLFQFDPSGEPIIKQVVEAVRRADAVVVDVSGMNANVMYELGLAHSSGKPVVLLSDGATPVPFDIAQFRVLIYDLTSSLPAFRAELESALLRAFEVGSGAFRDPFEIFQEVFGKEKRKTVFISYSHADTAYLNRLRIHLKPLEKSGLIELWEDTRIDAGQKWKKEIEAALERAAIAVLLISADFLASDFIVDNELPPLLVAAEKKGTTILPVILKPCRFLRDASLSAFQAINQPSKPLILLEEGEQELIYAKVADRIEAVVKPAK